MTRETKPLDSRQAQTLLRVFESLGVPLMGAVDALLAWQAPQQGALDRYASEDAARNFTSLLSSTITTGTQLAARFGGVKPDDAEIVRLKSATLASHVIAQHYVLSGQMPDESFNQRFASAFDGVLALSDSFALLPQKTEHDGDMLAARVEAFTPFVQAVMRLSLGGDDAAIIKQLGERLCDKATALADAFAEGAQVHPQVFAQRELAFLKGGAALLARACEVEMDRVQQALAQGQLSAPPASDVLVARIFTRFEGGLDVLRTVIGFVRGPVPSARSASGEGSVKPAPAQKKDDTVVPQAAAPVGNPANPMSFFAKKDSSQSGGAS
jgi:hypothetical protein